ncbi:hypothetical protein K438DRAFT_1976550 [Mycena galopus ATCC 62051]|nr:hypothetical protein K438DRAFT_1976550 [Mycena galopus ATCC 62051]
MPPGPGISLNTILDYTVAVANTLQDAASQVPFVGRVCALTLAIIPMVQNTKFQKDRCLRIVDDIHQMLCVLTNLALHSDDIESVDTLHQIAQFSA